jgi:DNA repair ATPase RecN
MNQKYVIIFLLISIIISISYKCNKLNINEHFNEEKDGINSIDNSDKNSIDIVSLDYNNIKFTDCLNEGENGLNQQINLNIEGIYDTFDNIIENSENKFNDFNKKYNDEMDNLQQLWHDIKELQNTEYLEDDLEDNLSYTINELKDENIFNNPDDNGSNDCEKYVKPYKKNKIINENIENLLKNNKIWKTDDDSDNTFEKKVNDNFDNYKNAASGLEEQLNDINNKFLEIKESLTGSSSIFGSLESNITTNKNNLYNSLEDNSRLIKYYIQDLESLVIQLLKKKKKIMNLK